MSLFPPPKIIKTEVFAPVPGRYRKKGVVTHWVETPSWRCADRVLSGGSVF